ncbi:MAG: hypothetical protein JJT76_19335 [Clostridiaceae bacterium]|nr:hypothetical protein [Clostridiaceae bacterium]
MVKIQGIYKKVEKGMWQSYKIMATEDLGKESNYKNISFITSLGKEKIDSDRTKGFCHLKFKANFIVEGLDLAQLQLENRLEIGSAIVEIIALGKKCHEDCPALGKKNNCSFKEHIFFCRVLKDGIVEYNNTVKMI